jgi:hypothetical protein
MLLAETVTFDPGVVIVVFLLFLAVVLSAVVVVVGGFVAGVLAARDPARAGSAAVWTACAAVEGAGLVGAVAGGWLGGAAFIAGILALTAAARFLPTPRG